MSGKSGLSVAGAKTYRATAIGARVLVDTPSGRSASNAGLLKYACRPMGIVPPR